MIIFDLEKELNEKDDTVIKKLFYKITTIIDNNNIHYGNIDINYKNDRYYDLIFPFIRIILKNFNKENL
jgi:hypothetical protein